MLYTEIHVAKNKIHVSLISKRLPEYYYKLLLRPLFMNCHCEERSNLISRLPSSVSLLAMTRKGIAREKKW